MSHARGVIWRTTTAAYFAWAAAKPGNRNAAAIANRRAEIRVQLARSKSAAEFAALERLIDQADALLACEQYVPLAGKESPR